MNNYSLIVKNKVLSALNDYSMIEETKKIVVGFSGGADSICLLHILNDLKADFGFELCAAHINHGIRGAEAVRDADFAAEFCEDNKISFNLLEVDCVGLAEESGETLEECGRRIRYGFFNTLADGYTKIATAHNCNDNAETVIFNLIRGSSIKGVGGIPPVRDNIIRPLIYCTREEIEGYCAENKLTFVTDSTNLSDDYTRNKIRHLIIPVMEEINSGALSNISSFSESAKDVSDYLCKEALSALKCCFKGVNKYDAVRLSTYDKAVVKQAIVIAFENFCDKSIDSRKIEDIYSLLYKKGRIQLYGDIYVEVVKNELCFFVMENEQLDAPRCIDSLPFEFSYGSYKVSISKYENNSKKINKNVLDNLIDCDKIVGNVFLRNRLEGDKFTLPKRNVSKSLKKLFNEFNIPVEKRDSLPILCDDVGILWIDSIGVASRCSVDSHSCNIICVWGENNDKQ